MLLVIDIGNSSIKMGIFAKDLLLGRLRIPTFVTNDAALYRCEIEKLLSDKEGKKPLKGAIISSVVPGITDILARSAKEFCVGNPLIVTNALKTGLTYAVENPGEIGSDRIVGAVAALKILGSPAAVVDFGTATTISALKDRRFLGGALLPGLRLMGEALHRGTAKLPPVDGVLDAVPEVKALGKGTIASMISGMIYGTAGAVERILRDIEKEEDCRFRVVLTGGYSGTMARFVERESFLDPDLALTGLRLLYERNS
jgi:type III pantothenate kinase